MSGYCCEWFRQTEKAQRLAEVPLVEGLSRWEASVSSRTVVLLGLCSENGTVISQLSLQDREGSGCPQPLQNHWVRVKWVPQVRPAVVGRGTLHSCLYRPRAQPSGTAQLWAQFLQNTWHQLSSNARLNNTGLASAEWSDL